MWFQMVIKGKGMEAVLGVFLYIVSIRKKKKGILISHLTLIFSKKHDKSHFISYIINIIL